MYSLKWRAYAIRPYIFTINSVISQRYWVDTIWTLHLQQNHFRMKTVGRRGIRPVVAKRHADVSCLFKIMVVIRPCYIDLLMPFHGEPFKMYEWGFLLGGYSTVFPNLVWGFVSTSKDFQSWWVVTIVIRSASIKRGTLPVWKTTKLTKRGTLPAWQNH